MIHFNDLSSLYYLNIKADTANDIDFDAAQEIRHWTIRMLMLHVFEALEAVESVAASSHFQQIMTESNMKEALSELKPYLKSGAEREKVDRIVKCVRDKIGSHIDLDAIKKAIIWRGRNRDITGRINLETTPYNTRFYTGDDVIKTILVRQAWQLSEEGEDLEVKGEELAKWFIEIANILQAFLVKFLLNCMDNELI